MAQTLNELFPVGRVVLLKSGGPAMTVEMYRNDGLVCAQWFAGEQHMRDSFDPACLVLVSAWEAIRIETEATS